jgi:hypothetical protein
MLTLRVYADTSVFGGCFDPEFEKASEQFFHEVRARRSSRPISKTESQGRRPPMTPFTSLSPRSWQWISW